MGATGEELKEGKGVQKLANLKRSCLDPALSPCPTRRRGGGGSLRAFRRARDGAAKGRGSWERIRWPDAKFEVTSAKCDLRNEQQREKREESREQREERREKREERDKHQDERVEGRKRSQKGSQEAFGPRGAQAASEGGVVKQRVRSLATAQKHPADVSEVFFCFSWGAGGVFPKDSMTLRPSRWLAVAA